MSPRPIRARLLDLAVAAACVACVSAPLLQLGFAASPDSSVVESGGHVDQRVLKSGMISNPLNGSFDRGHSGKVNGSIQWDLYTTSSAGLKLLISSDRDPAMRDPTSGADVPDYGARPSTWKVGGSDRRFGFSVKGGLGLDQFEGGSKYRGFDGRRPIEVGRRGEAVSITRTTVMLQAEFGRKLADTARPAANIDATAVLNL